MYRKDEKGGKTEGFKYELGRGALDLITDFKGVITGRVEYLTGKVF